MWIQSYWSKQSAGVRHPCDKCEYASTTTFVLKRHIESKHKGVTYPFNICEYAETTAHQLKRHIESNH